MKKALIISAEGVRGRNSDNKLLRKNLNWEPTQPLIEGIRLTYKWIEEQVRKNISS